MSSTVIPETNGLELSCTFAEGSQAQSCILTLCKKENYIIEGSCLNIHVSRNVSIERISNLSPGLYTITEVAEVESDGNVTILRSEEALELFDVVIITHSTSPGLKLSCRMLF